MIDVKETEPITELFERYGFSKRGYGCEKTTGEAANITMHYEVYDIKDFATANTSVDSLQSKLKPLLKELKFILKTINIAMKVYNEKTGALHVTVSIQLLESVFENV